MTSVKCQIKKKKERKNYEHTTTQMTYNRSKLM